MKLFKPLYSIILIVVQLILSLIGYYDHIETIKELEKTKPGLLELINFSTPYETLFIFVLIIGFYEMLTKPSLFKTVIRIFLAFIVLGTQFSEIIPIEDFYSGVYNTAWFSSVVAITLILIRIGKYAIGKLSVGKLNKTEKASR